MMPALVRAGLVTKRTRELFERSVYRWMRPDDPQQDGGSEVGHERVNAAGAKY
jgi:hypothetical protein